ncbi:MAG: Holliday junction branch migration protein RuvA [Lachnospiraceae bacterium]|nr:Holliday junction branch migration protein RuvA [Lachnospiraceae bacterium]
MIAYLKGEIIDVSEDNLILEVQDIGYNVKISSSVANTLPSAGNIIKIYTYTLVKEDAFQLYGFLTKDDLEIFKKVITVNGIGPKGALAILSVMSSDELRFAIIAGDAKAISKAPGIGAKTAERLILDLRDKVSLEDAFEGAITKNNKPSEINNMTNQAKNEAIEALVALGYSASDALHAIKTVDISEDMNTETILKAALKKIN